MVLAFHPPPPPHFNIKVGYGKSPKKIIEIPNQVIVVFCLRLVQFIETNEDYEKMLIPPSKIHKSPKNDVARDM